MISTHFWSLISILNSEFQNSSFAKIFPEIFEKSGNSQEFAVLGKYQHIRYNSHSILSLRNRFWTKNFKIPNFLKVSRNFWKSGNSLEFAVLGQLQHIGYHSHSILVTEFQNSDNSGIFPHFFLEIYKFCKIQSFKIWIFLHFFQQLSGNNLEFTVLVCYDLSIKEMLSAFPLKIILWITWFVIF